MELDLTIHTLEELCNRLEDSGTIRSPNVIESFRKIDRGHFLPEEAGHSAYIDRPVKLNNFHQSAVHIYATAMEKLELEKGNSFLNLGSGTGYLSTLVERCIGPSIVHHGVELFAEVMDFAKKRYDEFCESIKEDEGERGKFGNIQFFCGNVLLLDPKECRTYDRIYVGAGCHGKYKDIFQSMLTIGGIMVGPFDDEILKITRVTEDTYSVELGSVVHFAPLRSEPKVKISLPKQGWSPVTHKSFPHLFHVGVKEILLAARREDSLAGTIPKQTWLDIFEYMTTDWFDLPLTKMEQLELQLEQEKKARERVEKELIDFKRESRQVKRERDIYMMLARRMQMQLREIALREVGTDRRRSNDQGEAGDEEDGGESGSEDSNGEDGGDNGPEGAPRNGAGGAAAARPQTSVALLAAQAVASATLLEGAVMENPVLSSGGPFQAPPRLFPMEILEAMSALEEEST